MNQLDKSWKKYFLSNSIDRNDASSQEGGAYSFKEKAIEKLERMKDAEFELDLSLTEIIKFIKELKAY